MISPGQTAYEAYARARNWRTYSGDPMPEWQSQDLELQNAWEAGALAVLGSYRIRDVDVDQNPNVLFRLTGESGDAPRVEGVQY